MEDAGLAGFLVYRLPARCQAPISQEYNVVRVASDQNKGHALALCCGVEFGCGGFINPRPKRERRLENARWYFRVEINQHIGSTRPVECLYFGGKVAIYKPSL